MDTHNRILSGELKLLPEYSIAAIQTRPQHRPMEWTEDKAMVLCKDMLNWMKVDENIFIEEYLIQHDIYSNGLINKLSTLYSSFKGMYAKCKRLQEFKLLNNGLNNKYNAKITTFVLSNHHNYKAESNTNIEVNINSPKVYIPDNSRDTAFYEKHNKFGESKQ